MKGSIQLTEQERKRLLKAYRLGEHVRVARRAHVLLLLADGTTWEQICRLLYASNDLIAEVRRTFLAGGVDAVLGQADICESVPWWLSWIQRWVQQHTPQDFGYFRSRWSCETLAEVLAWEAGVRRSAETIRRWLHAWGFAWRRPRPVVGPVDPEYNVKLRRIKRLPDDEVAVFQDEVDVHLNPKIGSMWMTKGQQAEILTPGNNRKCHVSGSLVWNTGTLLVSQPQRRVVRVSPGRPAALAAVLEADSRDLRQRPLPQLPEGLGYLQQWDHRIVLYFLPRYAPETNPIERVWWHLHETITRNHRCSTLSELVRQAFDWFRTHNNHDLDMHQSFAKAV